MKQNAILGCVTIGMLLIAAGIVIPIFQGSIKSDIFRYIYSTGAVILLVGRLFSGYHGCNLRLKRLYRLETWSAVFFCVAAFFLFYDKSVLRDPLAFTLAGGLIQTYTSIMIPRQIQKDTK